MEDIYEYEADQQAEYDMMRKDEETHYLYQGDTDIAFWQYENLQITYRKYGYEKLVKVMCYCYPVIKKYIGYLDVSKYESEEEKKTATIDAFYFVYNRN